MLSISILPDYCHSDKLSIIKKGKLENTAEFSTTYYAHTNIRSLRKYNTGKKGKSKDTGSGFLIRYRRTELNLFNFCYKQQF